MLWKGSYVWRSELKVIQFEIGGNKEKVLSTYMNSKCYRMVLSRKMQFGTYKGDDIFNWLSSWFVRFIICRADNIILRSMIYKLQKWELIEPSQLERIICYPHYEGESPRKQLCNANLSLGTLGLTHFNF